MLQELLQKVKRLEIKMRRVVDTAFAGEYRSAFRGTGLEFDEVRAYRYGDDVRSIDWNVTAKTGNVYVKVFKEEREQNISILFDASASERFGRDKVEKLRIGTELAALLAFAAMKNGDRFGLTLFTDRIETFFKPAKGRNHILGVIGALMQQKPQGRGTNIKAAIDFYMRTQHRRSIVFIISDFLDQGYERSLIHLRQKHEVILIRLFHPDETLRGLGGVVPTLDMESGRQQWLNLRSATYANILGETFDGVTRRLELISKQHKIDYLPIDSTQDYLPPLLGLFHARSRRQGSRGKK